jgi:hypothetical protein
VLLIYGSTYSDVKRQTNAKFQTFHSTKVYFIPQLVIWFAQIQIPNVISHLITYCSSNDIKLFIPILPNQFTSIVCYFVFVCLVVFNATYNNISVISWGSVLLVEETEGPGENHRPVASHWQNLSHNIVHLTLIEIRSHISGDWHWLHR